MAIDQGASVVVTAPTGSGKTVVAEAAIARAIGRGLRAVYTTPLKALSNQKFADFRRAYGDGRVGLLTGDNAINGSAPIVVMTTEVLRNMMYAASPDLVDVGVVVLDEVHYLQDRSRGAVWEEIIVHLDRDIPLVCLSATIANPEEFATWVGERRGHTTLIVERERPVPLESNYLVRDRWESNALRLMPVFHRTRLNDRVVRMLRSGRGRDHRYLAPRRHETCVMLRRRGLLPAIYFIFSRAGCDAAARTVVERGLRLTTAEEASAIRDEAERRTSHLSPQDLAVLGYGRWLWSLEAGVAAHHAGMVPALKETVEHLFAVGLVRLVFATETLALGINMPARTAVLENLSKFTGESHELLQPGDYTQLTGRAGRRGIDEEGAAVVLHSPHVPFERVAGIAAAGNHPLRSSFKPTYNMVVNLIATYPRQDAERLLDASFAQFHAGRRHRELTKSIATLGSEAARLRALAECEAGDVWAAIEQTGGRSDVGMIAFAEATAEGQVLRWVEHGKSRRHVVVARSYGKRPRLLLVSDQGELRRLDPSNIPRSVERIGTVELVGPFRPRDPRFRSRVAEDLARWEPAPDSEPVGPGDPTEGVMACADAEAHLAAGRRALRVERRLAREQRLIGSVGPGLVPRLRAIQGLLERTGYTEGWSLTPAGARLRLLYNEKDLLLAGAIQARLFDGLNGPETAALASAFTFEPRREPGSGFWPTDDLEDRSDALLELWQELTRAERQADLPETGMPESGFAHTAYRWCRGAGLEDLFDDDAGDVGGFVRNCRQLIDLLRQMLDFAPIWTRGCATP